MQVDKKKIYNGVKGLLILMLLLGISFLVVMQWKSDVIVRKVVNLVQSQMEDTLRYDDISLEWVRYFPSIALRLDGLKAGKSKEPFIKGGSIDIVLRLFPLLQDKIIINKLIISDCHLNITKINGRWSYDLFKKTEVPNEKRAALSGTDDNSKWETLVRQIVIKNTSVLYDDKEASFLRLVIDEGKMNGDMNGKLFDADLELKGILQNLKNSSYILANPFTFHLTGKYKYDSGSKQQELKNWKIENDGLELEIYGIISQKEDHQLIDMHASWTDADPQVLIELLPAMEIKNWNAYRVSGKSEGQVEIKGISSKVESPHISFSSELKNGIIRFPGDGGQLKNIVLDLAYDSGELSSKTKSYFRANLRNGSYQGNSLEGSLVMNNLDNPVIDAEMKGSLPASMLNIFMDSSAWDFQEGVFEIDKYSLKGLSMKSISTKAFIEKSIADLTADKVRFSYKGDNMQVNEGEMELDASGKMKLNIAAFVWNKAKGEDINGDLHFMSDKVEFDMNGKHSQGKVEVKGNITNMSTRPVMNADWMIEDIEMKELLGSFENFDQTFITSENLQGKTDIWTHTVIPYDANQNILTKDIIVRAAIEIKDGELEGMKTLEDFSKYVHLDDLQHIRFNRFRNYMKIENGKVYLPVVFIQSSAINLSVNGVHSFDQEILYNLKINAGQAAANKLKKIDQEKKPKKARKSGWINLYFVLSGKVSDVKYEQDRTQVISSFEQSAKMKEELRNYLVDRFGHDVYWLEPNEWEDIPEYK